MYMHTACPSENGIMVKKWVATYVGKNFLILPMSPYWYWDSPPGLARFSYLQKYSQNSNPILDLQRVSNIIKLVPIVMNNVHLKNMQDFNVNQNFQLQISLRNVVELLANCWHVYCISDLEWSIRQHTHFRGKIISFDHFVPQKGFFSWYHSKKGKLRVGVQIPFTLF